MHPRKDIVQFPFYIVSGRNTGILDTTFSKANTELWPGRTLGSAELLCVANISSGNIFVRDRVFKIPFGNDFFNLAWIYNSKAASTEKWRIGVRKIISVDANQLVMLEEDGSHIIYPFQQVDRAYCAAIYNNGQPFITNRTDGCWVWYHPGQQISEVFDKNYNLIEHYNLNGYKLGFHYNSANQLDQVNLEDGKSYNLAYNGDQVDFSHYDPATKKTSKLALFTFSKSYLQSTTIYSLDDGSQYTNQYQYAAAGNNDLSSISQSDTTYLSIQYCQRQQLSFPNFFQTYKHGKQADSAETTVQYDKPDPLNVRSKTKDFIYIGIGSIGRWFQLDKNGYVKNYYVDCDFTHPHVREMYNYVFSDVGQIEKITYPDQSSQTYTYSPGPKTLFSQIDRDNKKTIYYLSTGKKQRLPTVTATVLNSDITLYERYIYQRQEAVSPKLIFTAQLRFKVSPEGRVTEYCYDPLVPQMLLHIKRYAGAVYFENNNPPQMPYSLALIKEWAQAQALNTIKLTDVAVSAAGVPFSTRDYAVIDEKGKGVIDSRSGYHNVSRNLYGDIDVTIVARDVKKPLDGELKESRSFDGLSRFLQHKDAAGQVTQQVFADAKGSQIVKLPSGTVKTIFQNEAGVVNEVIQNFSDYSGNKVDLHVNTMRNFSHPCVEDTGSVSRYNNTLAAQSDVKDAVVISSKVAALPDNRGLIHWTVSAAGAIVQHDVDRINRFKKITAFNNKLNPESYYLGYPKFVPPALIESKHIKPDAANDRVAYEFYDSVGRIICSVDGENFLLEYVYDTLGRSLGTVQYSDKIDNTVLQGLQKDAITTLKNKTVDPTKDRFKQKFYDNDGLLIGEKNAAGYVTEYSYDAANNLKQKIIYFNSVDKKNPVNKYATLAATRPQPDRVNDIVNQYFFDGRGQKTSELDSAGFLTTFIYTSDGLLLTKTRYADKPVLDSKTGAPMLPSAASPNAKNNLILNYEYDKLCRETKCIDSRGRVEEKSYDTEGNIVIHTIRDIASQAVKGDYCRQVRKQYDGMNRVIAECNPLVSLSIIQIEQDQKLTPAEKASAIQLIWNNQAQHTAYDLLSNKIWQTDTLGNKTYYYYDADKNLRFVVDGTGAVTEKTYNSFNDVALSKKYYTRLSSDVKNKLTGGDEKLMPALTTSAQDIIESFEYDKRGSKTSKIDTDQNKTSYVFDAYAQLQQEIIPVDTMNSLTNNIEYDLRGNEVKKTTVGGNLQVSKLRIYSHPLNKLTLEVDDPNGLQSKRAYQYDTQGNLSSFYDNGAHTAYNQYDAFGRPLQITDAEQRVTYIAYDDSARTEARRFADDKPNIITSKNVFNEVVQQANGLNAMTQFNHDGMGNVTTTIFPIPQAQSQQVFDTENHLQSTISIAQLVNEFKRDANGNVVSLVEDKLGKQYQTTYQRDAFARVENQVDPLKIVTQSVYDHQDNEVSRLEDSVTLAKLTSQTFNKIKGKLSYAEGDVKVPNQYFKAINRDGINREIGAVIDPDTKYTKQLNLTTAQSLDNLNRVVSSIDENGNVTRSFYDKQNRLRFTVNPLGGVKETVYDLTGKVTQQRDYMTPVDTKQLSDQSTLADIVALAKRSLNDKASYFYYDYRGLECFRLDVLTMPDNTTSQVSVHQTNYDAALCAGSVIDYAAALSVTNIDQLSVAQIGQQLVKDSTNDRVLYFVRDAMGQVRFSLDSLGYVAESQFDLSGNCIAKTSYAVPVANPAAVALLPDNQVRANLTPDIKRDSTTWYTYDNFNRVRFTVNPEGLVNEVTYNYYGDQLSSCNYNQLLTVFSSYADLCNKLNSYTYDQTKDRLTAYTYDTLRRKKSITHPDGSLVQFSANIVGLNLTTADEELSITTYQYDAAKRCTADIAPSTTNLFNSSINPAVTAASIYEATGRLQTLIEAKGAPQARQYSYSYDACNYPTVCKLETVTAGLKDQKTPNLFNKKVYDALHQVVALQKKSAEWEFCLYNNAGQKTHKINQLGYVTEFTRNAFGEIKAKRQYATPMPIIMDGSANDARVKGIARSDLKLVQTSQDIVTLYEMNQRGCKVKESIVLPITRDQKLQDSVTVSSTEFQYDANKKCIYRAVNLSASVSNPRKSETYFIYDRAQQQTAKIHADNRLFISLRNSFGEINNKQAFYNPLSVKPQVTWTLQDAMSVNVLIPSSLDRQSSMIYDMNGRIVTTSKNAIRQLMVNTAAMNAKDVKQQPIFIIQDDAKNKTVVKAYQRNKRGDIVVTTRENNTQTYRWYDERASLVAITGIPRNYQGKSTYPLSVYQVDSLKQTTDQRSYNKGYTNPSLQLPKNMQIDNSDQLVTHAFDLQGRNFKTTLDPVGLSITQQKKFNANDKPIYEQDANNNFTFYYYDEIGRCRLTLFPDGSAIENTYDAYDNIHMTRHYAMSIVLPQNPEVLDYIQALALFKPSSNDQVSYHYYDAANRLRFKVALNQDDNNVLQGYVAEINYNGGTHPIQQTAYNAQIAINNVDSDTINTITLAVSKVANAKLDRSTWYIRDNAGRVRFKIDAQGRVIEQQYGFNHKECIVQTQYATPVINPAQYANYAVEDFVKVIKSAVNDRTHYKVYNESGKIIYTVSPNGNVTRYAYDAMLCEIGRTHFAKAIPAPQSYSALLVTLANIQPDPANDQTVVNQYDTAGNLINSYDEEGYSEAYTIDLFNNQDSKTNRNGQTAIKLFDKANRHYRSESAAFNYTVVSFDATKKQLIPTTTRGKFIEEKQLDGAGNEKVITLGKDTPDVRSVSLNYNFMKKMVSRLNTMQVDSGDTKKPDFINRPEITANIVTQMFYDAKQNLVAEQLESGNWKFYIYDARGFKRFEILQGSSNNQQQGLVVEFQNNAFGEVKTQISYATAISIDFASFKKIPVVAMQATDFKISLDANNDRTLHFEYSTTGKRTRIVKDQMLTVVNSQPQLAKAVRISDMKDEKTSLQTDNLNLVLLAPETVIQYNNFDEMFLVSNRIDQTLWLETRQWRDNNGELIAEMNQDGTPNRYIKDTFDRIQQKREHFNPLKSKPDMNATAAQIDAAITVDSADRTTYFSYNRRNDLLTETVLQVTVQQGALDAKNLPYMQNVVSDLKRSYDYTPTQKRYKVTNEAGNSSYDYFNELDINVAHTDAPRLLTANATALSIPLQQTWVDIHSKPAMTAQYANGTTSSNGMTFVAPVSDPINDVVQIIARNSCGLEIIRQDGAKNLFATTYALSSKPVRQWHMTTMYAANSFLTSQLDEKANSTSKSLKGSAIAPIKVTYTDEIRCLFDIFDRVAEKRTLRDANQHQTTLYQYNAFDENTAEDDGSNTWPLKRSFNQAGSRWRTNEDNGIPTLTIGDLSNRPIYKLQTPSAPSTFMQIAYADLKNTANLSDVEKTITLYSADTHTSTLTKPPLVQLPVSNNLPLQTCVSTINKNGSYQTILSWPAVHVTNVMPTVATAVDNMPRMTLQAEGGNKGPIAFDIVTQNGISSVDISLLPADIYNAVWSFTSLTGDYKAPSNIVYSFGQRLQCNTLSSTNSINVTVQPDQATGRVYLGGNVSNVKSVNLVIDGTQGSNMPVQQDAKTKQLYVDCSALSSGEYVFVPIDGNATAMQKTVPFTIYTSIPNKTLLTQTFNFTATLSVDSSNPQQIAIQLTAPSRFVQSVLNIVSYYTDDNKVEKTFTGVATYDSSSQQYIADVGNNIDTIEALTLVIPFTAKKQLIVYNNVLPSSNPPTKLHQALKKTLLVHENKPKIVASVLADKKGNAEHFECIHADAPAAEESFEHVTHHDVKESVSTNKSLLQDKKSSAQMTYVFPEQTILCIQDPINVITTPVDISFLDMSQDLQATQKQLINVGFDLQGFSYYNVTDMLPGYYPFNYVILPSSQPLINSNKSQFMLSGNGMVFANSVPLLKLAAEQAVSHKFTRDRWENIIAEVDSLGNKISRQFNFRNQEIKMIKPPVNSVLSPAILHGYNMTGAPIGVINAKGYTSIRVLNSADQELSSILPDGVHTRDTQWNLLSQPLRYDEPSGRYTMVTYNQANFILQTTMPHPANPAQAVKIIFEVNEMGHKISETNENNHTTQYGYDANAFLINEFNAAYSTKMQNDRNGQMLQRTYSNGWSQKWTRDFFGNALSQVDLGGARITYQLNGKNEIFKQQITGGQRTGSAKIVTQRENVVIQDWRGTYVTLPANVYTPQTFATPDQSLEFERKNGYLTKVTDNANQQYINFEYDTEGSITLLDVRSLDNTPLRRISSQFDSWRRIVHSFDTYLTVDFTYDLNDNIERMQSVFVNPDTQKTEFNDAKNIYDTADRQLIDGSFGMLMSYDTKTGLRTTQTVNGQSTNLTYKAGNLASTSGALTSTRIPDAMGNESSYDDSTMTRTVIGRDEKERVVSNQLIVKGKYTTVTQSNFAGNPTAQPAAEHIDYPTSLMRVSAQSNSADEKDQKEMLTATSINDDNQYNVVLFEKPQLSSMIVNRHAYYNTSAQSNNLYDANRNLCGIQNFNDSTSLANDPYQSALTILTSIWNGFPLARTTVPLNMANKKSTTARENLNFTTTQFHSLATYTINRDALASQIDGKLKPNFLQTNTSQGGKSVYVYDINNNSYVKTAVQSGQSAKQLTLSTVARAVSQSYPATSPDTLTIMGEGQTIADVMQNDSSSGFTADQVAAMNGMNPDQKLVQNMPVRMPQYISSSNRVGQATNFDIFTAALSAGFMPYVETRFKEERSNPFRELLNIVLVGAATFAGISLGIGPVLTAIFSDVLGGAFAAGISAGVGAAAGNALGQELAVDFGLQDKFRLKSAVEAGFLAGVGGGIRAAQFTPTQTVATLAAADAGMQVAEIRLGIRQKFNFNEVGSTIINATMNGLLISNPNQTWSEYVAQSLFKNTATVLASNALYGGSPDISNIAAQILGSSVVDVAARGINSVKDQMEVRRRAAMRPIFDPRAHDFDDQDFVVPVKAEAKSNRPISTTVRGRPQLNSPSVTARNTATMKRSALTLFSDTKINTSNNRSVGQSYLTSPERVAHYQDEIFNHSVLMESSNNSTTWTRVMGGLQAAGGLVEALGGIAFGVLTAETGIGALAGAAIYLQGIDNYQAGFRTAVSGAQQATNFENILQSYGVSDSTALMAEMGMGLLSANPSSLARVAINPERVVGSLLSSANIFAQTVTVNTVFVGDIGLFSQVVKGVNLDEKTVRFTELVSRGSKTDVRILLRSGELNLPIEQANKLLYTLGNGRMDGVTLKLMNNGNIRLLAERAGYSNGYQRMSFEVNQLGQTNKVVQTAFDDANKLVPQRPGEIKNNLYDVKKWNRVIY